MLCLIVRTMTPEVVTLSDTFQDSEQTFCCRRALCQINRLFRDPTYPRPSPSCVYVLHLPDDLSSHMKSHDWKCGEILVHASRYITQGEVSVAPKCLLPFLKERPAKITPMKIDLRYSCREALPEELRGIVPGDVVHAQET